MVPVVLTIGGTDSSGGAGLSQDQRSLQSMNVQQRLVVSLVSAQTHDKHLHCEPVSDESFHAQLEAAFAPSPPNAIKIGALANHRQVAMIIAVLTQYPAIPVVWDPVLQTSGGGSLGELSFDAVADLLAVTTIATPNLPELGVLTGFTLRHDGDELEAAHQLLALGCQHVLVTGGHRSIAEPLRDRLYSNEQIWQFLPRSKVSSGLRGSGCLLASAIAGVLALNYDVADAVCYAEAVVASGFSAAAPVDDGATPLVTTIATTPPPPKNQHFPVVERGLNRPLPALCFPRLRIPQPGLYPVVDSVDWLKKLLPLGFSIIQLRIKQPTNALSQQIKQAVELARQFDTQLFINDHWQLAVEHQAFGVHLGQDDLAAADLHAITNAGLRLGVSTHGYAELCRVLPLTPSYIALGHVYPTRTKAMPSMPQGTSRLADYRALCGDIPTVAIGGISLDNIDSVVSTGVDSVAVVTAITESPDVPTAVHALKRRLVHA